MHASRGGMLQLEKWAWRKPVVIYQLSIRLLDPVAVRFRRTKFVEELDILAIFSCTGDALQHRLLFSESRGKRWTPSTKVRSQLVGCWSACGLHSMATAPRQCSDAGTPTLSGLRHRLGPSGKLKVIKWATCLAVVSARIREQKAKARATRYIWIVYPRPGYSPPYSHPF